MTTTMTWITLFIAGLFEVGWAMGLKYTEGFSRLWPSVGTLASMFISFWLLSRAMRELPVGTAYAVWTGIGSVGAVTLGILVLGESAAPARLVCVGFIILGIIGLKVLGH